MKIFLWSNSFIFYVELLHKIILSTKSEDAGEVHQNLQVTVVILVFCITVNLLVKAQLYVNVLSETLH